MKAIWIEDQDVEIWPVVRRMEREGFSVTVFRKLDSAKPMLNDSEGWKLVLLDSFFPRPDGGAIHSGILLYKELRGGVYGEWGRTVAVVFDTGYQEIVREQTKDTGEPPIGILSKPTNPQHMIDVLRQSKLL